MIWGYFYSRHSFASERSCLELLDMLQKAPSGLRPTRFGYSESAKTPLREEPDKAVGLLKGRGSGGSVYLKGSKYRALWVPAWLEGGTASWQLYLSDSYFRSEARTNQFLDFVTALMDSYSFVYAGIGPEDDWKAKHWRRMNLPGGGVATASIGLDLERALPSIAWFTGFGSEVADAIGVRHLDAHRVHRVIELSDSSTALVLRSQPLRGTVPERCAEDEETMRLLGDRYFFNLARPDGPFDVVPGVTRGFAERSSIINLAELEKFRRTAATHSDGSMATSLADLAEDLVVFLHGEVPELHRYDRNAMESLSSYLYDHPQRMEYGYEYLFNEFVPALGAYVGEVLRREGAGAWETAEPIVQSVLRTGSKVHVDPFVLAFEVVFGDASLIPRLESWLSGAIQ